MTRLGINKEIVKTSEFAGMYSDYQPFSDREKQKIMADMQRIYNEFLKKVAGNRKMAVADVDKIARGRVWSGRAALEFATGRRAGRFERRPGRGQKAGPHPAHGKGRGAHLSAEKVFFGNDLRAGRRQGRKIPWMCRPGCRFTSAFSRPWPCRLPSVSTKTHCSPKGVDKLDASG